MYVFDKPDDIVNEQTSQNLMRMRPGGIRSNERCCGTPLTLTRLRHLRPVGVLQARLRQSKQQKQSVEIAWFDAASAQSANEPDHLASTFLFKTDQNIKTLNFDNIATADDNQMYETKNMQSARLSKSSEFEPGDLRSMSENELQNDYLPKRKKFSFFNRD